MAASFTRPQALVANSTSSAINAPLDPVPDNETPCIGTSFTYPGWSVLNFTSEEIDGKPVVQLVLNSEATGFLQSCSGQGDGYLTCQSSKLPSGLLDSPTTTVLYQSSVLFVNQTWSCLIPGAGRK